MSATVYVVTCEVAGETLLICVATSLNDAETLAIRFRQHDTETRVWPEQRRLQIAQRLDQVPRYVVQAVRLVDLRAEVEAQVSALIPAVWRATEFAKG